MWFSGSLSESRLLSVLVLASQKFSLASQDAGFRPSEKDVILFVSLVPKMNKDGTASKVILDLDNCLKVAVDALQGVVYHNDNQVKFILSTYSSEPREDGGLDIGIAEI